MIDIIVCFSIFLIMIAADRKLSLWLKIPGLAACTVVIVFSLKNYLTT